MNDAAPPAHGLINRVVEGFLKGNLSILLMVVGLMAGAVSLWITPREEQAGNRPTRRVYAITPEGEAVFQQDHELDCSRIARQTFSGVMGRSLQR